MRGRFRPSRALWVLPIVAVLSLACAGFAGAQDKGSTAPPQKGAADQMSQEEMQKMMALATPGEHHKEMNKLVGDWKTSMKMWMGPGEPTAMTGTAHYEWTLGGRYLESKHTGSINGMPFEGKEIDGYDNAKKEYFSLWMDNFGTGVMHLTGQPSTDGTGVTYTGTEFDPSQMKDIPVREEVRWTGEKSYLFTMYMQMPGPDGKPQETKVMEIAAEKQ